VGIDCFLPDLYSPKIKEGRTAELVRDFDKNFTFIPLDLRTSNLDILDKFDFRDVVHEAAMPGLSSNWGNFQPYYSCNIEGLHRLLEKAKNWQLKSFVHASTSSVYGINAVGNESESLQPTSPYGVSKLAAENLLFAYRTWFNLPVKILRYFSVYGPNQRPDMAFSKLIDAILQNRDFTLFGDGKQSRSNTYIDDVVEATILALSKGESGDIFNICGAETRSMLEVFDLLENISGRKIRLIVEAKRRGDQQTTSGSSVKARKVLGWEPKYNLAMGLEKQFQEALKQKK
jgi:UDP-glucose 4-epimerase